MSETKKEIIILHETALQSWMRDASSVVMFVALIGIGVYLDSSAMQWVGAILGFLTIIGKASALHNKSKIMIEQARMKLAAIDAALSGEAK